MGLIPVPDGWCAAVVTHLQMIERPRPSPLPDTRLRFVRWPQPDPIKYRTLFLRVGAPWLWFSRAILDDGTLRSMVGDPLVEVFAVLDQQGIEVGLVELDFRVSRHCEIAYFGLVAELAGHGHGRWLMALTLGQAWRDGIKRVWLHTCSLDHPSALNFYRAQGFTPSKREVETFPDPRLSGHLPGHAAPQVPIIAAH